MQRPEAAQTAPADQNGSAASNGFAGNGSGSGPAKAESAPAPAADPYKDITPFGRKLITVIASHDDVSCRDPAKVPTLLQLASEVRRQPML